MRKIIFYFFIIISIVQFDYASSVKKELNFAYYIPSMDDIDAKDIKISLQFWAKELGERTGIVVNSLFYTNIKKLKNDFDLKKIDVVTASPLVFIKNFDLSTFSSGFKSVVSNEVSRNRLLILVQRKSKINKLKDLKNKTIARLDSEIEELYINRNLQKAFRKDADEFLKSTLFVKKYSKAILKLFFKKVDACIVSESAFNLASEMNPQIRKKLKIIDSENVNLVGSSFFRRGVDQDILEKFQEEAFKVHLTKRGRQILTVFKADAVVESKIEDLDSVKKIYKEYLALKK